MTFKIIYLSSTGQLAKLPDLGIINIGGTEGPTFTVAGKPLMFADGTSTDGTGQSFVADLQKAYDNSQGLISLSTNKSLVIKSTSNNLFSVDASTGKVTITGDLEVRGSNTLVDGILSNVDQIVIGPPTGSAPALIIEPLSAVSMTADLVKIKAQNGGPDVLRLTNAGELFLGTSSVNAHLNVTGVKHSADQISAGPFSNITGNTVAQALASVDTKLSSVASSIKTHEHIQSVAAQVWTVQHNQNSNRPTVTIYDDGNYQVLPDEVQILDLNTVLVYFNTPMTGRAILILF